MNYLKLFEDFEEKLFYIIDANDYTDMYHYSINLDDYRKDIIEIIKTRLPKAFGHDQFSCFTIKNKYEVFIYERLHSLVEYTFFITEDDWIYLKAINHGEHITRKFTGMDFYKCDSIKGLISAIKYDFETNQSNTRLFYKLPDEFLSYGSMARHITQNYFMSCNKQLLGTPIQFSISEFPKQQVESILDELPIKPRKYRLENVVNQIYALHFYGEDGKLGISIPFYYIKESNQFICHREFFSYYYACCGVEGLKQLVNHIIMSNK